MSESTEAGDGFLDRRIRAVPCYSLEMPPEPHDPRLRTLTGRPDVPNRKMESTNERSPSIVAVGLVLAIAFRVGLITLVVWGVRALFPSTGPEQPQAQARPTPCHILDQRYAEG